MAYDFTHDGYDLSGYDQKLVKQAQGGTNWGKNDQARYDKLVAEKKARVQEVRAGRAEDFKNQKIKSAKDFNFDQHNKKGVEGTHISGQEVRYLRSRHGKGGNVRDTYAALTAQKEAGATFGGRAQKQYDRMGHRINKMNERAAAKEKARAAQSVPPADQPQDRIQPAPDPDSQPIYLPNPGQTGNQDNDTSIKNSQEQNVNQDNDINSTVDGNNNYVVNNQDNSIRQYGGDNRSFVYNSNGGDGLTDTPASMATLAGFYAPDDSPAATASRLDFHQDMNTQAQKKYADTSHIAMGAIKRANQNSYIDPAGIDARVRGREQNSYDRAALMSKNLWGDLANMNFNWTSNKPAEKVEQPDFKKMKDDYTDF